jgi:NAD(P)-dependent dehydrogenase (short-subunit alcohol dehydrogenase family)
MPPSPEVSAASTAPVALVTGAGKRLGREIALTLARAGWRVAVHYRSSQADAQHTVADCAALAGTNTAPQAHFHADFHADLNDEASTRALVPAVLARMGQLDTVVNSAALFEHDDSATLSYTSLEQHLRANTAAPIVLAQALHSHICARQQAGQSTARGVVVNLLDQKLWNPNPDFLSYTLSKVALEAANTLLAMALAPQLRVVGVAPGLTLTSHMLSEEKFQALHQLSPLGHSSTAQDVCSTVLFALSNGSITGTTLLVDGGQHLMKFERDFSLM